MLYKKEGSNKWWYSFTYHGRRIQKSSGVENKKEAETIEAAKRTQLAKGEVGLSERPHYTVDELLDRLKQRWELKEKASVQNLSLLKKTKEAFGTKMAEEVTTQDIERFQNRRRKAEYANATTNRIVQCLRRGFNLSGVEFPEFELLSEADNVRQGKFSFADMDKLLSNLPDDGLRDFVCFAYNTGMRKSECAALRWSYLHGATIIVPAGVCKNRKPHRIPVAGPLVEILKRREDAHSFKSGDLTRLSEYIFHRGDGQPISEFKKSWARAVCAAGLGTRVCPRCGAESLLTRCAVCKPKTKTRFVGRIFHDLRRTFISDAVDAGQAQSTIMAISGHRTVHTFIRYAIASDVAKSEVFEKVAARRQAG